MKKIVLLIVFGLILFGCIQSNEKKQVNDSNQFDLNNLGGIDLSSTVEKGDTIKVEYIGKFPDSGEVFDKSEGRGPLEFVAGAGQMIKGFDKAVLGMKLNQEKTVVIPPEEAYGTADSGQKTEIPLSQIDGGENIEVGTVLYTPQGMEGKVIEINEGIAVVEFIHPMAGKTLEFWIKVVEITKA